MLDTIYNSSITGDYWIKVVLLVLGVGFPTLMAAIQFYYNVTHYVSWAWFDDVAEVFLLSLVVGGAASLVGVALIIPELILEGHIK